MINHKILNICNWQGCPCFWSHWFSSNILWHLQARGCKWSSWRRLILPLSAFQAQARQFPTPAIPLNCYSWASTLSRKCSWHPPKIFCSGKCTQVSRTPCKTENGRVFVLVLVRTLTSTQISFHTWNKYPPSSQANPNSWAPFTTYHPTHPNTPDTSLQTDPP